MPSGFQQDINQLRPAFFRIVLDMTNTSIYTSNSNNNYNGSVNPYNWDALTDAGIALPTTVAAGVKLARGNIRFQRIVEEITKYADAQILDVEVSGMSNGDTQPTELAFTVRYDRFGFDADGFDDAAGDSPLLTAERKYLLSITNGSTNSPYDGDSINNTYEAIQEAVMRALISNVTRSTRVYVPDEGSSPATGEGWQQQVSASDVTINEDDCTYSDLRDTITVTGPLDGTTLTTD